MATWDNESKNSATFTNQVKVGYGGISVGMPIGLLLALTYGAPPDLVFSNDSKNSSTWNNESKN